MTTFISRSTPPSVSSDPVDLSQLISTCGVKVRIVEDNTVDPPMLIITEEAVPPYPEETLLLKPLHVPLTVMDLVRIIDRLGYPIEYEELK